MNIKIVLFFVAVLAVFTKSGLASGCPDPPNEGKVHICHALGNGNFEHLTISDNALEGHLMHGDIFPTLGGLDCNCVEIVFVSMCREPYVQNGSANCEGFNPGDVCQMSCSHGFRLNGGPLTCLQDGEWDHTPECVQLRCFPPAQDISCCTAVKLCGHGEGDCDGDEDCLSGHTCGRDNCEQFDSGFDGSYDCCEANKVSNETVAPTNVTTASLTEYPTGSPTVPPTESPTVSPTESPTVSPTESPTISPTESPTVSPTESPTESPTDISPTCPREANHSMYYPVGISGTDDWNIAERECNLQFLGGHLPSARTDEETQYIAHLTQTILSSSTSWLGFSAGPCESVWAWTDQPENGLYAGSCLCACQETCFSAWISGEPGYGDRCAYSVATLDGAWSGTTCQGGPQRRFLCEVPITYKFGNSSLSWNEASLECHNQGGELASIWSVKENTRMQSMCCTGQCWFGLNDQDFQYKWIFGDYKTFTVFIADEFQGTSLSYTNWDSTGLHSGCALLNNDGTWTSRSCSDYNAGYICAIPSTARPTDDLTAEPTAHPTAEPTERQVLTLPIFQPTPQLTFQPTEIPLEVMLVQALEEHSKVLQQHVQQTESRVQNLQTQMNAMDVKLDTIVGSLYPAETLTPTQVPTPSPSSAPTSRPACEEETGAWVFAAPLEMTTPQDAISCCKQCIDNDNCTKWQFMPPVLCILLDDAGTSTRADAAWTRGQKIE